MEEEELVAWTLEEYLDFLNSPSTVFAEQIMDAWIEWPFSKENSEEQEDLKFFNCRCCGNFYYSEETEDAILSSFIKTKGFHSKGFYDIFGIMSV